MSSPKSRIAMPIRVLLTSILALVLAGGTFFAGRRSVDHRRTPSVAAPGEAEPMVAAAPPTATRRNGPARPMPCVTLPTAPAAPSEDPERQAAVRSHRAELLLEDVFQELDVRAKRGIEPAETRAGSVLPYLSGILRGSIQGDPAMRTAFSAQFTSALCERSLAEDQTISVAHMAMLLPDIATPRGFDCFFSKATESVPLWTMLDAWRRSGIEKTPVLARLQAASTDSRTARRFLSTEEAIAQRMPSALATYRAAQNKEMSP
jgi:hypothetical protein